MPDGSARVPRARWATVLKKSIREFKPDGVPDLAAALTYYGFLALFQQCSY